MQSAYRHIGISAYLRISFLKCMIIAIPLVLLAASCEPREQIINEGDVLLDDSVTVVHVKEYIERDSFFRVVTKQGVLVNFVMAANEKEFRDSTFSETDYFANGNPQATRVFKFGVQNGVWKSWYEDGKTKSNTLVVDGELRDYFSYYANGAIAVTASRQPDGMSSRTERWPNGNLKQEFLTDSLGNGRCTNYHANGMKSDSGGFNLYMPFDTWKRWDSLGTPLPDTTYGHAVTH